MSPVEVGTATGAGAFAAAALAACIRYLPPIMAKLATPEPAAARAAAALPSSDVAVAVLQSEMNQAQDDIVDVRGELRAIHAKLDAQTGTLGEIKGQLGLLISTRAH